MYKRTLQPYTNECMYMHRQWRPLHLLCSWSGYWLVIRKTFTVVEQSIYWAINNVEENVHNLLHN
jgi:hypothetical protein